MAVNPIQSTDGFVAAFDQHATTIHRYAARRVGGVLADDICSETFVTAFERRNDFVGTEHGVLPWLYGIAARRLSKHHRAETRRWKAYARTGAEAPVSGSDPRLDGVLAHAELAQVLAATSTTGPACPASRGSAPAPTTSRSAIRRQADQLLRG